jgi:hypothetical protein
MEMPTEELNLEHTSSSFLSGKLPKTANKEETQLIIGNCVTCWLILSTVKEDEVFGEGRSVGQSVCPPFRSNLTVKSLNIISASFHVMPLDRQPGSSLRYVSTKICFKVRKLLQQILISCTEIGISYFRTYIKQS